MCTYWFENANYNVSSLKLASLEDNTTVTFGNRYKISYNLNCELIITININNKKFNIKIFTTSYYKNILFIYRNKLFEGYKNNN